MNPKPSTLNLKVLILNPKGLKPQTPKSKPEISNTKFKRRALNSEPNPQPWTHYPLIYTLRPLLLKRNPITKSWTLNPKPQTLNPEPRTLDP